MSKRLLTWGGAGAVGLGAYYLYQGRGDPKVAEKKFEADAHHYAAEAKKHIPGGNDTKGRSVPGEYGQEAKKSIEGYAREEADKFDRKVGEMSAEARKKYEEYRKEGEKLRGDFNTKVDQFDAVAQKKAAESKGWFSGWFGGK